MALDITVWLPTFILNRTGNKALDSMAKSCLFSSLQDEISRWAESLPEGLDLSPEAMFPKLSKEEAQGNRPRLQKLDGDLAAKRVPSAATWYEAVFEQWEEVRRRLKESERQKLFNIAPAKATVIFRDLAEALHRRCAQDEQLFRGTVVEELRKLAPGEMNEQQVAEGLITFLEDRHLLFAVYSQETPIGCYESSKFIRATLTEVMTKLPRSGTLHGLCDKMRKPSAALMRSIEQLKLQRAESLGDVSAETSTKFFDSLRQFRKECGNPVRKICDEYGISAGDGLQSLWNK